MSSTRLVQQCLSWLANHYELLTSRLEFIQRYENFLHSLCVLPLDLINGPFVRKIVDSKFTKEELKSLKKEEKRAVDALFVGACTLARIIKSGASGEYDVRGMFEGEGVTETEFSRLVLFGGAVKELKGILDAHRKKGLFLDVGQLLGGFETISQTGGKPSRCMTRKLEVFHRITGVPRQKRRGRHEMHSAPKEQDGSDSEDQHGSEDESRGHQFEARVPAVVENMCNEADFAEALELVMDYDLDYSGMKSEM